MGVQELPMASFPSNLTLKVLSQFVADQILKLILFFFFRENKMTFHVNSR